MTTRPLASDLTIAIPTLGRPLLRDCLASIADGTVWPAELLVVDQGRSAAVAGWIDELRRQGLAARHLPSAQTGIAAGTNRALEQITTRYAAVTHDDCRVRPGWLAEMARRLPQIGTALLTGRVEPTGEGVVPTVRTSMAPAVHAHPRLDGDDLFPPNMGFPLDVVRRVGYLDEHPSLRLAGEDNDWAYRALRTGVPIVYDPAIVVDHLAWQPATALPDIYRRYARGQGAFYGKHLRRGDPFIARRAARDLLRGPWLLARGAATRNRGLLALASGEVRGLLPGIVAGLRNRGPQR